MFQARKVEQHERKKELKEKLKEKKKRVQNRVANRAEASRLGLGGILNSRPDLMEEFCDPDVQDAIRDIYDDPANLPKYQNNPKVMRLAKYLKVAQK